MEIFLRLIIAHIISDFALQPDRMVKGKMSENKCKSIRYILLHSAIHAVITYILLMMWSNWIIPAVIFVFHSIIDFIKVYLEKINNRTSEISEKEKDRKNKTDLLLFISDQILHIAVITAIFLYIDTEYDFSKLATALVLKLQDIRFLILVTGYLLMMKPSSVLLSIMLSRWSDKIKTSEKDKGIIKNNDEKTTLPFAGECIGYLERILILTFVLTNNIGAVGFLITAKSIFRFGDLKKAQAIKMTEYVIIGTFISFTIAIITGFIIKHII